MATMNKKNATADYDDTNLTTADKAQIRKALNNHIDRIEAHSFGLLLRLYHLIVAFSDTYMRNQK